MGIVLENRFLSVFLSNKIMHQVKIKNYQFSGDELLMWTIETFTLFYERTWAQKFVFPFVGLMPVFMSIFRYSNHLNTRLVWYWNVRFVSGCQMVQSSNVGLKTGPEKKAFLWSKISSIGMVCQVMWLPFEWMNECYSSMTYNL